MSECHHCLGTEKCRFATLRDNGERGDDKVLWWNCLICGESEPFSVVSDQLLDRPRCRVCGSREAQTFTVPNTRDPVELTKLPDGTEQLTVKEPGKVIRYLELAPSTFVR